MLVTYLINTNKGTHLASRTGEPSFSLTHSSEQYSLKLDLCLIHKVGVKEPAEEEIQTGEGEQRARMQQRLIPLQGNLCRAPRPLVSPLKAGAMPAGPPCRLHQCVCAFPTSAALCPSLYMEAIAKLVLGGRGGSAPPPQPLLV